MNLPYIPAITWFIIMFVTMGGLAVIKLLCWHTILRHDYIIKDARGGKAIRRGMFWMALMMLLSLALYFDMLEFVEQFCALTPARSFIAHSLVTLATIACIASDVDHYLSLISRVNI